MAIVTWKNSTTKPTTLYFANLSVHDTFKNASHRSQGAVYMKVKNEHGSYFMLELETGKLWPPTSAAVEHVNVKIEIDSPKPNLVGRDYSIDNHSDYY